MIAGDTIQITGARGRSAAPLPADSTTSLKSTIVGNALETTSVCPTAGVKKTIPFSAVGGGLALLVEAGRREVYTKR